MEAFEGLLNYALTNSSDYQWKYSEGKILQHFHQSEGSSEQFGSYYHGKGGDDDRTEEANSDTHEGDRHPPNPFLSPHDDISLNVEHGKIGQEKEDAGKNDKVAFFLNLVDPQSEDGHQTGPDHVRDHQIDAGVVGFIDTDEHGSIVLVAVIEEGNKESFTEGSYYYEKPITARELEDIFEVYVLPSRLLLGRTHVVLVYHRVHLHLH